MNAEHECNPKSPFLPTRESLLSRLKDVADEGSWREFFESYWKVIYNFSRKRGLSDSEAQDVVQETMIALTRHLKNFKYDRRRGSFKTWLMELTSWKIVDQIRKRDKAVQAEADAAMTPDRHDWDDDWRTNIAEEALRRVQASAAPRAFQAFATCVLQGKTAGETARLLMMSVPAVYMATFKVRRLIKKEAAKLEKADL